MRGIAKVARVAHPVSSHTRLLAVLAYFDESGTHEQSKVITLAGFIATAKRWEVFERKWKDALRRANLSAFHMTDFENRQREFSQLDNEARLRLIVKLASIIKDQILYGVGVSMIMADYQEVILPLLTTGDDPKKEPYRFCFQTCLELILQLVEIPKTERLAIVLDENRPMHGFIGEAFIEMKRERQWEHLFGSLTFSSRLETTPLQAADVLAYECYKYVAHQVVEEPIRPMRKLLESLISSRRLLLGYYDRKALLATVEKVKAMKSSL